MPFDFNRFVRQPSTIHGLAVAAAAIGGALAHLATGNATLDGVVIILAYVLVHLGVDDHSAASTAMATLAGDVVQLAPMATGSTTPHTTADLIKLVADAQAVWMASHPPAGPAVAPPATNAGAPAPATS